MHHIACWPRLHEKVREEGMIEESRDSHCRQATRSIGNTMSYSTRPAPSHWPRILLRSVSPCSACSRRVVFLDDGKIPFPHFAFTNTSFRMRSWGLVAT